MAHITTGVGMSTVSFSEDCGNALTDHCLYVRPYFLLSELTASAAGDVMQHVTFMGGFRYPWHCASRR